MSRNTLSLGGTLKTSAIASAALLMAGCATHQGYMHPDTGRALREAMNKQIIDPNPVPGAPVLAPEKAAAAVDRYMKDAIKPPRTDASTGFSTDGD